MNEVAAFVNVAVNVTVPPFATSDALTAREAVGAATTVTTVVAVAVAVPNATLSVYVVLPTIGLQVKVCVVGFEPLGAPPTQPLFTVAVAPDGLNRAVSVGPVPEVTA